MIRNNTDVVIYDIRDPSSFQSGHIPGAKLLSHQMITKCPPEIKQKPVIIYCYHGISSQAAADFLQQQGFVEVYSMIGGFTAWSERYNVSTD
ncbi:MAG: rhodanese-like domain-containing protein [Pseudomonadota bacterium]|nr:rhodanese-like domain-containing protein [Pseudomonadota bacterium]